MATRASVFDTVHRRTGTRARVLSEPAVGTTEDEEYTLEPILRFGCIDIAKRTGRLESTAEITLVAGQAEYAVPNHVAGARALVTTKPLDHVSGKKARQEASETGTPEMFAFDQGSLVLAPTPSAAFLASQSTATLYYLMATIETDAAAWTSGTTEEDPADDLVAWLPPELEKALTHYVIAEWYQDVGLYEDSDRFRAQYRDELREHILTYDSRNQSTTRITPRYF